MRVIVDTRDAHQEEITYRSGRLGRRADAVAASPRHILSLQRDSGPEWGLCVCVCVCVCVFVCLCVCVITAGPVIVL